ncbi:LysR family transcriptional regulator [Verticiella sediminum]|uniref:LysR family transcriptional regulator n=2 Tax=Verticiella sediminum TaxID=1247510 RepID=A0A556AJQ5_9BURK|nr:LysR family transcriptional regulator [Verticiella sediminum]
MRIPPLPALRAFLAACRAGSYSAAGEELGLTHGAISRQIQALEAWLGQRLFERSGQRMVATPHALAFAQEVGVALERIDAAARRYGKGSATSLLRVSAPATFAMRWLHPRLPMFHARHPGIQVQVVTATTQQLALSGSFDLAIRVGVYSQAHFTAVAFLDEWHTIIAAPALLARSPLESPDDLHAHLLLDTETRPGLWQQWFNAAGLRDTRELRYQRYDHFYVTHAALLDGLGVGIGPLPTLGKDVEAGRLTLPFPEIVTASQRYLSLTPVGLPKTVAHRHFEAWLVEEGALAGDD